MGFAWSPPCIRVLAAGHRALLVDGQLHEGTSSSPAEYGDGTHAEEVLIESLQGE